MNLLLSVGLSLLLNIFHDLDIRLLKALYENRNPAFDSVFIVITNSAAAIAFGVPVIILIAGLLKKKKVMWQNALAILLPVAISAIVANILKFSLDMPRPYDLYPFIEKLSSGGSPSFPSGHTADAFAFAVAAGLTYPKWNIIFPCLLWAALVGTSRMWLGVHFPSDVIAGAFIGAICAGIYYWIRKKNSTKTDDLLS
jgi:membrane-associated phospholipid phosphatase